MTATGGDKQDEPQERVFTMVVVGDGSGWGKR